jgi:Heterokaryon incompatibility protein (HET)
MILTPVIPTISLISKCCTDRLDYSFIEQSPPPPFSESPPRNSAARRNRRFRQGDCDNLNPNYRSMFVAFDRCFFSEEPTPIPCQHLYVDRLIEVFRSSELKSCRRARCVASWEALGKLVPRCPSWPAIEGWVRQIVACYCSQQADDDRDNMELIAQLLLRRMSMMQDRPIVVVSRSKMREMHRCQHVHDTDWRHAVILFELVPLLSWLSGRILEKYIPFIEPRYAVKLSEAGYQSLKDMLLPKYVDNALRRADELGLCPHRVWAVVGNLPMREHLLPGLVPDVGDFPEFQVTRHGEAHKNCTLDFCQESTINSTRVIQLHLCENPSSCELTLAHMFPSDCLNAAACDKQLTTAWALDGCSVLSRGQSYMAISHVWADGTGVGTGTHGRVNKCLYDFFSKIARELRCDGIWWDTVCIPTEKIARAKAISNMHLYYSDATCTLVHDRYLFMNPWTNAESACFEIVMSSWFNRGWTALELAKSKKVVVVFASSDPPGYVLKNLDEDILAQRGTLCSLPRQIATMAVRALRSGLNNINDLLTSIGPRSTSWSRDRAIISGLLVGVAVDDSKDSQREIYQKVVVKLGQISDSNLFHTLSVIEDGGFSWLPHDFFKLPVAPIDAQLLSIQDNGDLVGIWRVLTPYPPGELPNIDTFVWGYSHPVTELRVKMALMHLPTDHIILAERYDGEPTRGLLVQVIRPLSSERSTIRCQLVGQVHFAAAGPVRSPFANIRVRIVGDSFGVVESERDLNGDTAIEYVNRIIAEQSRTISASS